MPFHFLYRTARFLYNSKILDSSQIENESPEKQKGCLSPLGDLREKSFKIAWWPKGFSVQPAKIGTVTGEQLVAMFFPLNKL